MSHFKVRVEKICWKCTFRRIVICVFMTVLSIQVVLIVYASDCFTVAASTVGISSVLSTAKKVVLGLCDAKEYQLMVSICLLFPVLFRAGITNSAELVGLIKKTYSE